MTINRRKSEYCDNTGKRQSSCAKRGA